MTMTTSLLNTTLILPLFQALVYIFLTDINFTNWSQKTKLQIALGVLNLKEKFGRSKVKVEAQRLSPAEFNIGNIWKDGIRHLSKPITNTNVGSVANIMKHIDPILKKWKCLQLAT